MTNPAKDWREELRALMQMEEMPVLEDFIQKTLENKAVIKGERRRIIEQIREEERARIVERIEEYYIDGDWQNNQTLDRIIKDIQALDQAVAILRK